MISIRTIISSVLLAGVISCGTAWAKGPAKDDLSLRTLVIDPGHGGKDPGTVSPDKKTMEKTLTLAISRKFADKVRNAYPEMTVKLTREGDSFLDLDKRAKKASDAGANLFVSIHINGTKNPKTNGFAAYILGPAQKRNYDSYDVNLEVCKRENSVIFLEDDYSTRYKDFDNSPESQILMQLMQNAFREQSLAFAELVSDKMGAGPFDKTWDVLQDNFAVLRRASMPAVLLEFGYITNPGDLAKLRQDANIDKIVDNLFAAFAEYKKSYDESVSLGRDQKNGASAAAPKAEPASKETKASAAKDTPAKTQTSSGSQAAAASKPSEGVLYGAQVLASSKQMSASDRYFKGYEVIAVQKGTLYKYILSPSEDRAEAVKKYREVKKSFPDCFFVKVYGEEISRENP